MNREAQLARTRAAIANGRTAETPRRRVDARADARVTGICVDCGRSHDAANRHRLIRPMLGMDPVDIAREWSCFYGPIGEPGWQRSAGYRLLFRDLKALRDPTRSTLSREAADVL